jgi:hypothetical protein
VVVVVGLTFVEPLADGEVNVPGVMAMLVAPDAVQFSALLVPGLMLGGSAVNDEIVGTTPAPEGEPDGVVEPQPANPAQTRRMRLMRIKMIKTGTRRCLPEKSGPGKARRFLQNEVVEYIRNPKQTQSISHAAAVVALDGPSPMGRVRRSYDRGTGVIRRSTLVTAQSAGAFGYGHYCAGRDSVKDVFESSSDFCLNNPTRSDQ